MSVWTNDDGGRLRACFAGSRRVGDGGRLGPHACGSVELTPFSNLEKTAVLQEARIFHDLNLNARKCTMLLTKILYLIYQGEILATTEATEVFFAITKLFQSKDVRGCSVARLERMQGPPHSPGLPPLPLLVRFLRWPCGAWCTS